MAAKREVPEWSARFSAGVTGQVAALLSTAQSRKEARTYLYLFLPHRVRHVQPHFPTPTRLIYILQPRSCNFFPPVKPSPLLTLPDGSVNLKFPAQAAVGLRSHILDMDWKAGEHELSSQKNLSPSSFTFGFPKPIFSLSLAHMVS